MSPFTHDPETEGWIKNAKNRDKPYGIIFHHGLIIISVATDDKLAIQKQVHHKGHVKWRVVNQSPRKRNVSLKSRCKENRISWDPADSRVTTDNRVESSVEIKGTYQGETTYYYEDISVAFKVKTSGSETVSTMANDIRTPVNSQFDVFENGGPVKAISSTGGMPPKGNPSPKP